MRPPMIARISCVVALAFAATSTLAARPAMLDPWTGPFGGVPAWNKVKVDEFEPAFEIAMNEERAELKKIAENKAVPSFANTILAMEHAGSTYRRLGTYFQVYTSVLDIGDMPKVEAAMAPKLAAFDDEITQNDKLYRRIEAVYKGLDKSRLTPEQRRLTWLYYTNFVRSGANLNADQKKQLSDINQQLATLYTKFGQNVLDDEAKKFTVFDSVNQLAGLPADMIDAAARAAEKRGLPGKWVIVNTRSAAEPFMTLASDRAARQKVYQAFISRGDGNDATDNKQNISDILKLRYQRAQLLGYKTHAHWRVEPEMAKTPENAMALMEQVWKPAVETVHRDVAEMQKIVDAEGGNFKLAAWDYRYYIEKLRKQKLNLDMAEVTPYLQLDKLREGMFWAAGQLYGYKFKPLKDIPVYQSDVVVYEVLNARNKHIGLWYFDPYAREGKRSGAWMNAYREQSHDGNVTTIVSNNANFIKGKPGEPILMSWDDATTMFHEFGHALHGLSSNVTYRTLSGTNVARDFVEFPSQINEHWFPTPEILNQFALNEKTGKPIPADLVAKLQKAKTFNQGFITVEYLSAALIDMKLHLAGGTPIDAAKFEKEELDKLGMPEEIVMRHRTPQFNHVFSGDEYSAGYYAYLWADALTADVWEAFEEGKGPYDPAVAKRFHDTILSVGNTVDQTEAFRNFRGRDVDTSALMRKRGFLPPKVQVAN